MPTTKFVLLAVLLIAFALVSETGAQYYYSPYAYSSYYYPYSYYGSYYGYGYPYYSAYGWYGKREAGFEPQQQQPQQ